MFVIADASRPPPTAKLYLIKIISQTFISEQEHFSPQYFFIDFFPKEVTSSSFHRSGGGRLSRVWGWLSWKSCQQEEEKKSPTGPPGRHSPIHQSGSSANPLHSRSHPLGLKPTLLPETTTSSRVPEIHPFMSAWDHTPSHMWTTWWLHCVGLLWGWHHEDVCLRFDCCSKWINAQLKPNQTTNEIKTSLVALTSSEHYDNKTF